MKKILLSMAVVASTMMVACGNKTDNAEGATEEVAVETVEVEEVAPAAAATEMTSTEANSLLDNIKSAASKENVEKAINYVKELVSSGKLEEAKGYLEQVKPYADKVGCSALVSQVEQAVKLAENAGGNVKEAAAQKVDEAKANLTEKANEKVNEAKDKAANAVSGLLK